MYNSPAKQTVFWLFCKVDKYYAFCVMDDEMSGKMERNKISNICFLIY